MAENITSYDTLMKLAESSFAVADISKLNLEAGYEAKITQTKDLPIVTLEYTCGLKDKPHDMACIPDSDSFVIKRAVLDALEQADLQRLCINLEMAVVLWNIAYNVCSGTDVVESRLERIQHDYYVNITKNVGCIGRGSTYLNCILRNLIRVYQFLASGEDRRFGQVSPYFYKISRLAEEMSEITKEISDSFHSFSKCVLEQGTVIVAFEKDGRLKEMLEKQLREVHASEKESDKNESMIAEFIGKIKNTDLNKADFSVAVTSLQLAAVCFETAASVFTDISAFWIGAESSLKNLTGDTVLSSLKDLLQTAKDNPAKAAVYAKTDKAFVRGWYIMECKWLARQIIYEVCFRSCDNAREWADNALRCYHTANGDYRKLVQEMIVQLEEKLKDHSCYLKKKNADQKK